MASSFAARPTLLLHTNAGFTTWPNVDAGGGTKGLLDFNVGQSAIWLIHQRVNLMPEGVVTSIQEFDAVGGRTRSTGVTISPGLRWSHDFASGLQIVPGIAAPFGFRANDGQRGLLLYLSFEHEMPGLRKQ